MPHIPTAAPKSNFPIAPSAVQSPCNAGQSPTKVPLTQMVNGQAAMLPGRGPGAENLRREIVAGATQSLSATSALDAPSSFSIERMRNFFYEVDSNTWALPQKSPAFSALQPLLGNDLGGISLHLTRGISPPDHCNEPYSVMRKDPHNPNHALMCVEVGPGLREVVKATFNAAHVPGFAEVVRKAP